MKSEFFIKEDRIYAGTKIEIILQSDWITTIERENEEIVSVKYPPFVAYLERDLILSLNYPKEETELSRMRYKTFEGEYLETDKIEQVYVSQDNTVVVDTGEVVYYFSVLSIRMQLELGQKGWFD